METLWRSWSVSGTSSTRLGCVLGRLGEVLGRLEVSLDLFRVSWDALELSFDRLGTSLEMFSGVLEPSLGFLGRLGAVMEASWEVLKLFRERYHIHC